MTKTRSLVHMLTIAAARLEQDHANPKLIEALRGAAKEYAGRRAEGRTWSDAEQRRVDRQRNLFTILIPCPQKDALRDAMLQRAYDLLWDGDAMGCDAILEFVPGAAAEQMLAAWVADQDGKKPPSQWYSGKAA